MPKFNRKRKQSSTSKDNTEYEIDAPKAKFRPFDEAAQAEEEYLSQVLFGDSSTFLQSLEEAEKEADAPGPSNLETDSGVGEESGDSEDSDRKPAWYDEDDDGIDVGQALHAQRRKLPPGGINSRDNKYSDLLKHKFNSVVGTPKWASLDKCKSEDSDDELLKTCGFLGQTTKTSLRSGVLECKKVKDLNQETYSEGPYINSIEFHPSSSVAFVAGNKGVLSLFAVDGKYNNKLHSVGFEKFPIICAKFTANGNEIILGSRHNYLYNYDLLAGKYTKYNLPPGLTQLKKFVVSPDSQYIAAAGKFGEVHILTAISKEKIVTLKQDSEVTALEFNPNGNLLFGHSDTGDVTIWDMNTRRVSHKFVDEGCLQGTTLSVSSSNQFIATGSAQGVVNLYGMEDVIHNKTPKPRKTILNLTTAVGDMKFNGTSEILAFSAPDIPNSVKLFHVGSGSVFSNFPSFGSKMGNINSLNFSPGSGYVAFGNRKSIVSLYRLKHFKNY